MRPSNVDAASLSDVQTREPIIDDRGTLRSLGANLCVRWDQRQLSNENESEKNIRWTRESWEALRPFLVTGSYGNYASDEGDAIERAVYGPNYDRLVALKNKYDPTNLFRMNQNVKPNQAIPSVMTA